MKRWIALSLALLLLTGCGRKEITAAPQNGEPPATVEPTIEEIQLDCSGTDAMPWYNAQIAAFGLRLLKETMTAGENTLVSPLSVLSTLAMTANGADGETLAQMEAAMGSSTEELNHWYRYGVDQEDKFLHLSNSLWIKDDPNLTVNDGFIQAVETWYQADLMISPFHASTPGEINRYVQEATHDMVREVVQEIPEETVLYLVNALAFEAKWAEPYNAYQVDAHDFLTEDGQTQTVMMMWSEESRYMENDLATGFLKPYRSGKTDRYAFAALLPKEGVTLEEMVAGMDGSALQSLLGNWQDTRVRTALPKFQVEYHRELSEILKAMGMSHAFAAETADFSRLGYYEGGNLCLDQVLHKSFLSVGEQGTCAGAATVISADAEGIMEQEVKTVVLDRPFLYMIVDTESNTPVFMGIFMDADESLWPEEQAETWDSPGENSMEGDACLIEG